MKVNLLKKATALILSVCMILSLTTPTFAAKTDPIHDSSAPGWTLVNGVLTIENDAGMNDWATNRSTYANQVTEAVIKDGVNDIVKRAFDECKNMTSIEIPSTVKSIGLEAFHSCTSLENITIPEGVETIGKSAFYSCTSFTSINIPDTVNAIGESAFYYCTNLKSINIPEGVKTIESGTFNSCIKLASVTIPEGVVTIGYLAFYDCRSLTSVTIPSTVRSIDQEAFSHCTGLASITILAGVETIRESAFFNCSNLTSIIIPDTLKIINRAAFQNCSGLTSVTLPAGLTAIKTDAFCGCTSLKSITIPAEVTSIELFAFYNSGLTSVTMLGTTPPRIGRDVFGNSGMQDESITVPEGYANDYKTAETWAAYANLVKPDHTHVGEHIPERPATCTQNGNKEYYTCSCDKWFSDSACQNEITDKNSVIITATGHTFSDAWTSDVNYHWHAATCEHTDEVKDKAEHTWDEGSITNPATETHPGTMTYTCTVCDKTNTEEIPQLPHTHAPSADWSEDESHHWHACSGCDEKLDLAAHTWDEGVITTEPAEDKDGVKTFTCDICKRTKTEPVPALGHIHNTDTNWTTDGSNHWHTCSGCDEKLDFAAHTWDEGVITTEPAEDKDGVKTFTCDICKRTKTEPVPALGHTHELMHVAYTKPTCAAEGTVEHYHCEKCGKNYSDSNGESELLEISIPIDSSNHAGETEICGAIKATCREKGYTGDTYCLGCDKILSHGEVLPISPYEHNYENSRCTHCGMIKPFAYRPVITYLNDTYHLYDGKTRRHIPDRRGRYTDGTYEWYVCADCGHEYDRKGLKIQTIDVSDPDSVELIVNDPVQCGDVELLFTAG